MGIEEMIKNFCAYLSLLVLLSSPVTLGTLLLARDASRFASTDPDTKAWFDSLSSGRGPCCSDADGYALSDVDWRNDGGHYQVLIDGAWLEVPDEAVVKVPNRVGRTMVWPIRFPDHVYIRCFMPGVMT